MTKDDKVYENYSDFWKFARETAERANKLPHWKFNRPVEGCDCEHCYPKPHRKDE